MPDEPKQCRSCHANIRFLKLNAKKPDGKNKYAVVNYEPLKVWVHVGGNWVVVSAYQDHHANCPDAEQYRKAPSQQRSTPSDDDFGIPF